MRRIALALGPFALLAATEASAQLACAERPKVVQQLAEQYKESPVAVGVSQNGDVIEVLTAPTGDSWTILITMPNGMSCVVAVGEAWQPVQSTAQLGQPS